MYIMFPKYTALSRHLIKSNNVEVHFNIYSNSRFLTEQQDNIIMVTEC